VFTSIELSALPVSIAVLGSLPQWTGVTGLEMGERYKILYGVYGTGGHQRGIRLVVDEWRWVGEPTKPDAWWTAERRGPARDWLLDRPTSV
jgi:hypothetical protein